MINPKFESRNSKQIYNSKYKNTKIFEQLNFKNLYINSKFGFRTSNFSMRGFTFPELLVTMAVFLILASLVTISVINVKQRTSLATTVNILISDIKQQQLKAMVGDTEGRGSTDSYGIHPLTDSYVLFHGDTFNTGTSGNFTVNLGDNVEFVSGSDFVFTRVTGEITSGATSITLRENTTGDQRTIQLNRYGVVTSVD